MKTVSPPLKVWFYVLFAFLIVQTGMYYFGRRALSNDVKKQIENALTIAKLVDKKQLNVVIIGTSLVGYGVECQQEISQSDSIGKFSGMRLIKVWRNGGHFKQFLKDSLLLKLLQVKPDLICIQTEILSTEFEIPTQSSSKIYQTIFNASVYNKEAIKHIIEDIGFKPFTRPLFQDCIPKTANLVIDTLNYQPLKRNVQSIDKYSFAFEDLKRLQQAGIKTVIVDIPRPVAVEQVAYTPLFTQELQQLLGVYKRRFGIEYWKYDGQPMYYQHFLDGGHLNHNGRHIFTNWLLNTIKQQHQL